MAITPFALTALTVVPAPAQVAGASAPASACGTHGVFSTNDGLDTCTYSPTNSSDTFTAPPGVTSLQMNLYGAGGYATNQAEPWLGGFCGGFQGNTWGTLPDVTPGEVFQVNVGGQGACDGAGGWNGGADAGEAATTHPNGAGGGGATDIRVSPYSLSQRILVAAGGGGDGGPADTLGAGAGGSGGGLTGGDGETATVTEGGLGGTGGTQTAAGATHGSGDSAGFGFGGGGGDFLDVGGGGGGGGGWYGGGGGEGGVGAGGGGGGSSYVASDFTNQGTTTNQAGNILQTGSATVNWDDPIPVTMVLSPTTAAPGSIQLQATITPSSATGTVDFSLQNGSSSTDLGSGNVNNGVAQQTTSALPAGADTIVATYSGDAQHQSGIQQKTIDVGTIPSITTQPTDQSGTAADVLEFTAGASGSPTPTVQWQFSTDSGSHWTNFEATYSRSDTIDVTGLSQPYGAFEYSVADGTELRAAFTNVMQTTYSNVATFHDTSAPAMWFQPNPSESVFPGNTFTAESAAVANPSPTVQWQVSTDGGIHWTNIGGATGTSILFGSPSSTYANVLESTYTLNNVTSAMNGNEYRAAWTNTSGTTYSNAATLTVATPNACVVANPTNTNYSHCAGVNFHGYDLHGINLNYADLTGADLSGANLVGATFQAANLSGANLSGEVVNGNNYLQFTQLFGANLTGANLTGDDFSYAALLGATVTNTDIMPANMTVDPQSANGASVSWTPTTVPGAPLYGCTPASGSTFAVGTTTVHCTVNSTDPEIGCSPAPCEATGTFTVMVNSPAAPVLDPTLGNPSDQSVSPGATAGFLSVGTGTPDPTEQWQISTDGGKNWTDISGANSAVYSLTAAMTDNGSEFRAEFSNFAGTVYSGAATLSVHLPYLDVVPDNQQMSYGGQVPNFTVQFYGLAPNDSLQNSVSGALQCDTTPSASSGLQAGSYPIVCSGMTSSTYTIRFDQGTLTVFPAKLKATPPSESKAYGEDDPSFGPTITGFVNNDNSSVVNAPPVCSVTVPHVNVGTYPVKCVGGDAGPNYSFDDSAVATLTISPATLTTMPPPPQFRPYGQPDPPFIPMITGFENSDTLSVVTTQPTCTVTGAHVSVGVYSVTCSGGDAGPNYSFDDSATGTLKVTPATLAVTPSPETKQYGQADPTFAYSITGYQNGDPASVVTTQPTCSVGGTHVGVGYYPITCSGGNAGSNYVFDDTATALLHITSATLTVTPAPESKVYGHADPTFGYTITGYQNGDLASVVTAAPTCSVPGTHVNVGSYTITCSGGNAGPNYGFDDSATALLGVTPATLTATPSSNTKVYGQPDPSFGPTISGFQNSDPSSVLTAPPACSVAGTHVNVGSYTVTCTGGSAGSNYTFDDSATATLQITPATLTVTPSPESKVYGHADPTFGYAITGYQNSDPASVVTTQPSCSVTGTQVIVGSYTITCSGGAAGSNYTFDDSATATLQITPATLTVTPAPESKVYGHADPTFGYTITGYQNSDPVSVVTTQPSCSVPVAHVNVGSYSISCSGGAAGSNYTFDDSATALLGVTPATLTATASSKTKVYGQPDPSFSPTITGFQNSDPSSVVTAPPACSVAGTHVKVGSYTVTCTGGSAGSNYTFDDSATATLQITPATLTVTPSPESKVYGHADPTFGYAITGYQNSDPASVVTTQPTCTVAGTHVIVGSYTITCSGGAAGSNYTFDDSATATLQITPATLTITANNQHRLFGSVNPVLTWSPNGFQYTDTFASAVTGSPVCSTPAARYSPGGTAAPWTRAYAISCTQGTLSAHNYTFQFVNGSLSVGYSSMVSGTPGSVTVAAGQAVLIEPGTTVKGSVSVSSGGALDIEGANVHNVASATGAVQLRSCGGSLGGLTVTGSSGLVIIGDDETNAALPSPCGGNTFTNSVSITSNTAGVEFDSNNVSGSLTIKSNTGTTPDGNTVDVVGNVVHGKWSVQ